MPTLTLKNIPDGLHARLKASAERNRRSLNSEILVRLERDIQDISQSVLDPVVHVEAPRLDRAVAARLPPARHPLQASGPRVIVVDSNVIAYCWLNGPMTGLAQRVRVVDPDWRVPVLWRSEMRSILAGYLRSGSLSLAEARRVMRHIEEALAGCEHLLPSDAVLKVIDATRLSAYDAEFVALAEELSVLLVTEDKAVLKGFPEAAISMEGFLA